MGRSIYGTKGLGTAPSIVAVASGTVEDAPSFAVLAAISSTES
jgi:hypothetical protein